MSREPTYLNIEISNASYDESSQKVKWLDVETHVSRSGAIVDRAKDYYASVFRLVFDLDVPVFIAEMQLPSADGVSLIYSCTIKSTIGGAVHRGRAFLKLPYRAADVVLYQQQPTNFYSSFWNYSQLCESMNNMLAEAYANLISAGSSVNANEVPFYTYNPTSGFFSLTTYPMSLYAYPHGADKVEIFFNAAAYPLIKGWDSYFLVNENENPDPNGEDYELLIYNNGTNFLPAPAVYSTGRTPTAAATSSITATQAFGTIYPGIVSVQVLSDMPSIGEYVPSVAGNEQSKILTDFRPDLTASGGATTQFYNANFGDCRWIKLTGEAPITQITVRIEAVDYLGVRHQLKLYSKSEQASMKICFAPREMVENLVAGEQ